MPRTKGAKNKNPITRTPCPHCGEEFSPNGMVNHVDSCIANPEVMSVTISVIHSLSTNGVLCRPTQYDNEVTARGRDGRSPIPYRRNIQKFLGTNRWDEKVAAWAGLPMPPDRTEATRAEMIRLSLELYGGEYGPAMSDWQMYAEGDVYQDSPLRAMYGKWENVLAHFGLRAAPASYYHVVRKERQDQAEAEQLELMESEAHEFALRKREKMNWPIRFIERVKLYYDWNIRQYRVTKLLEVA